MPIEQIESSRFNPLAALFGLIRGIFRKILTVVLAAVLLVTAGVVAFGATVIGLMMGVIVLLLRLINHKRTRSRSAMGESNQVTLEARPTRSGWTVE